MTQPDRDIPPGHTKPPIRNPGLPKDIKRTWRVISPLALPRHAQIVLLIAAGLGFVATLLDPDPATLQIIIGAVSLGAFGEAIREMRDANANEADEGLTRHFDRATGNLVWVTLAMLPAIMIAIGLRRLFGFEGLTFL